MNDRLLGIVLCGGRSSRMGRDKSALPHPAGGTFLSHAVDRLRGLCDGVCVSGACVTGSDMEIIEDPVAYRGPVVGIAASLQYADQHGYGACLVTPVDMPHLTLEDLQRLKDAWEQKRALCCVVSEEDDQIQPLAAIYPTSLRAEIQTLAESGKRSISRWIQSRQPERVLLPTSSCRNVNAPEDLADRAEP